METVLKRIWFCKLTNVDNSERHRGALPVLMGQSKCGKWQRFGSNDLSENNSCE